MSLKSLVFVTVSVSLLSLAMCFPEWLGLLSFVFLVPVLTLVNSPKEPFFYGGKLRWTGTAGLLFLFGLLFSLVSSFWIWSSYPLDWLSIDDPILGIGIIFTLWFSFCFLIALPLFFYGTFLYFVRFSESFLVSTLSSSLWVVLEYIRSWLVALSVYGEPSLLGPHHSYYSLGYTVYATPILKDLLPVGGIYLASFVIILINYFFYYTFIAYKKRFGTFLLIAIIALLLTSSSLMCWIRLKNQSVNSFIASVITTYLPRTTSEEVAKEKKRVAFEAVNSVKNNDGVVFLPENVSVMSEYKDRKFEGGIVADKLNLIVGSFFNGYYYNIFFLNPILDTVSYYDKQLLMPIGEYRVDLVRYLIKLTHNHDWLVSYDFAVTNAKRGGGAYVYKDINIEGLVLGGTLCSENISPYIFRKETQLGASVLVNLSSRTNFHQSDLLFRQTVAINSTRALENGRYLITVSNQEKSFVISDRGNITDISSSTKQYSYFNSVIPLLIYKTPYVKLGDYIVVFSFLLLLVFSTKNFLVRSLTVMVDSCRGILNRNHPRR